MSGNMLAGVVSDTHIAAGRGGEMFARLVDVCFRKCDIIIHAGDITDPEIFTGIDKEIVAVKGNMDAASPYPVKRIVNMLGKKVGVIHGYGAPGDIESRIRSEFDDIDCLVYGHTHFPRCESIDGVLFLNPGSPFDKRRAPEHTVGYLHVDGENIRGSIVQVETVSWNT